MAIIWGKVQQVDEYHYCSFLKSQVPQPTCCFHSGLGNMISFIITAPRLFISSLKDPQGICIRLRLRGWWGEEEVGWAVRMRSEMEVPPNSLIVVKERGSPTTTTWGGGTLGGVEVRRMSRLASSPSTRSSLQRRTTSMPFHTGWPAYHQQDLL